MEIVSAFQGHPDFAGRFLNQGLHVVGYMSINTHKVRYRDLKMIFSGFHWLRSRSPSPKRIKKESEYFCWFLLTFFPFSSWDGRYKIIVSKIWVNNIDRSGDPYLSTWPRKGVQRHRVCNGCIYGVDCRVFGEMRPEVDQVCLWTFMASKEVKEEKFQSVLASWWWEICSRPLWFPPSSWEQGCPDVHKNVRCMRKTLCLMACLVSARCLSRVTCRVTCGWWTMSPAALGTLQQAGTGGWFELCPLLW